MVSSFPDLLFLTQSLFRQPHCMVHHYSPLTMTTMKHSWPGMLERYYNNSSAHERGLHPRETDTQFENIPKVYRKQVQATVILDTQIDDTSFLVSSLTSVYQA